MKIARNLKYALLIGMVGLTTSCKKYFEGVNDDPNRPTEVPASVLLPSAQVSYAYGMAGDVSRFTSLIMQQVTGLDRQFATYQIYSITETDTDNWWRFNHYGGAMFDLNDIIIDAEAKHLHGYAGVSKILMAYGLMTATDLVGDIPYDEAFKGTENLTPAYNTQEEIYERIQTLLTEGKAELTEPSDGIEPDSDDLIYGGDLAQWTKFANVLSARAYLHLGKKSASNYASALTALGTEGVESFGSSADDAVMYFGSDETAAGPWYQYIDQRDDIGYEGFMFDTMAVLGDPRLPAYNNNGTLGDYFNTQAAPYFFASYMEQKFIEAEAAFQTGDLGRAALAHNAGVMESLSRHGVTDANFILNEASETAGTITLAKIMLHKYIAMFLDPEVFSDWRRTGFPALQPVASNVTSDIIPRRLPYPQSERLFNGANRPADNAITSRVWWDAN